MTSAFNRTSSAAMSARLLLRPSAQRSVIATVRPITQPSSCNRWTIAFTRGPSIAAVFGLKNPIIGSLDCCARTRNGQLTVVAPISVMNFRRVTAPRETKGVSHHHTTRPLSGARFAMREGDDCFGSKRKPRPCARETMTSGGIINPSSNVHWDLYVMEDHKRARSSAGVAWRYEALKNRRACFPLHALIGSFTTGSNQQSAWLRPRCCRKRKQIQSVRLTPPRDAALQAHRFGCGQVSRSEGLAYASEKSGSGTISTIRN